MGKPKRKSPTRNTAKIVRQDAVAERALEHEEAVTHMRDPFARPGEPGNRWLKYGSNGSIPKKYRSKVNKAIDLAYKLHFQPRFREVFRKTVSVLSSKDLPPFVYLDSLDSMVIHLAETSKDSRAQLELQDDAEARKKDPKYQSPAAFSIINGKDVWLREFLLQKDPKAIAGSLVHEAAHLAGAPGNPLAEMAIDTIHNAAGLPR